MRQKNKTKTKQVIAKMLRENVGRSIFDSGGTPQYDAAGNYIGSKDGYGRSFERNQHRDFDKEQAVVLHIDRYGIDVTLNLYHFLVARLTYDVRLNNLFDKFTEAMDENDSWFKLAETFPSFAEEHLNRPLSVKQRVERMLAADELSYSKAVNTYNGGGSLLSQVIQYVPFELDGSCYVALQIHGGADVRGGYTKPRIFSMEDEYTLYDDQRATIWCQGEHSWMTDDGYHWYFDGSTAGKQLGKYEIVEQEDGEPAFGSGSIVIDEDGNAHCPLCGEVLGAGE